MPAPLQVELTVEEDTSLRELSIATAVPRRTRQRAMVVRLNSSGWSVGQIVQHLQMLEHSVRRAIRQWQTVRLYGCGTSADQDGNATGRKTMCKRSSNGCRKSAATPVRNCVIN